MPASVRDVTGGGAHASLDALGSAATCRNSIEPLRPRGRHVQIGLLGSDDDIEAVPMASVIAKELELYGSHGMAAPDYPALLADVLSGRVSVASLVTRRIPLEQAPNALAALTTTLNTGSRSSSRDARPRWFTVIP